MVRFILLALSFFPFCLYATEEAIEQETPAFEEPAATETEDSLATDPYEGEEAPATETYGSDKPVYATEADEVVKLRAKVAAMEKEIHGLRTTKTSPPSSPVSAAPGQISGEGVPQVQSQKLDPDVAAVLTDLGIDTSNLQETMEATTPEEATAMAGAYKSAGSLEVGGAQAEFNRLQGDFKAAYASSDKAILAQFKARCIAFIEKYQTHSLSRSALYYLSRILLKNNEYKEAQNSFARVYKGDEQGPHAADALLGMAVTFVKQSNKPAAIKFVEKVKKDYRPEYLTGETKAELAALSKSLGITSMVKKPQTVIKKGVPQKQSAPKASQKMAVAA